MREIKDERALALLRSIATQAVEIQTKGFSTSVFASSNPEVEMVEELRRIDNFLDDLLHGDD